MEKTRKRILFIIIVIMLNIGADQITKIIAKNNLPKHETVNVLGDFFIFRLSTNTGAFLSFGANLGRPWRFIVFSIFPLLILAYVVYYVIKHEEMSKLELTAFCFIVGGGLGNLVDRIAYGGKVVDFMNMGIGNLRTGVFNVADISIMVGAGLLILAYVKKHLAEKKEKAAATAADENNKE